MMKLLDPQSTLAFTAWLKLQQNKFARTQNNVDHIFSRLGQ